MRPLRTSGNAAKLRAVSNQRQAKLSFQGYHLTQQGHEPGREKDSYALARELPVSICPMRQT